MGEGTLFQQSALRLSSDPFEAPLVITASTFRFIVTEQLAEAGVEATDILIEPDGKNTAPAILAAALHLEARDPGAIMLVAPSDHIIPDKKAFREVVLKGLPAVEAGQLVTFGIHPDRPEEGLTIEQAVVAYTRGSAYAELMERHKGTLTPGKLADLAVLSQDIFTIPVHALPGTFSLLTMVDGEVVWDAGMLPAAD
jgi:mannose-1-phosphate guanylyltransferase